MTDYFETKSQPITQVMVWQAYKNVRANQGSSGIDGMSWTYLDKHKKRELYKLWNRLTSGSYFPNPVRQVEIKKKDGGIRQLGIPILLDRIAQEVVKQKLELQVEPHFHNSSFGYRPNRSCHDAVAQSSRNTLFHDFAVDLDIKGFFDTIDHDLLLKAVSHYCKDLWILMYVSRWLKAGIVQQDGNELQTLQGTPQGGVISPLLANIYLHVVFDGWMEKKHPEKPFERYADDIVVHCKSEKQAKYMLNRIRDRMGSCKLILNETKTKIVHLRGESEKRYSKSYDFLGFTIRPNLVRLQDKVCLMGGIFVSTKSKSRIFKRLSKLNIHKRRTTIESIAKELSPMIRGIINYYHKFSNGSMHYVWYQLNVRLLKWVRWEKGLYKKASVKWLRQKYKMNPRLFPHWQLVHP